MNIKYILLYLWQLPQNICGLVYKNISKNNRLATIITEQSQEVGARVYLKKSLGGITLGKYIFIYQNDYNKEFTISHECGHVKQSKMLGPLYLIIIGIPSVLHAIFNDYIKCCDRQEEGYYHFFTESWANKLRSWTSKLTSIKVNSKK